MEAIVSREPNITLIREEVTKIPINDEGVTVVAAGPLCAEALTADIGRICGEMPHFYDASAPIVSAESIDMEKAFVASRYGKGDPDGGYINCSMNKEEYEFFHAELVTAQTAPLHDFDLSPKLYEGCMPIEALAKRGADAIRYGPMKPVGLRDPVSGRRPWAVLQLRAENAERTMFNLVGFQTNLKFGEQKRVFGLIPALKNADFLRFGVMHRNTYINSPALLNKDLSLKTAGTLFFAGQITGVEGYCESAACGIAAGINAARRAIGKEPLVFPRETMMGALLDYITSADPKKFSPMGANHGILPPLDEIIKDKRLRGQLLADRSLKALNEMMSRYGMK